MQTVGSDPSQHSQEFYQRLQQNMDMNLQYLHSQQEQHREQLNVRLDQMLMEVRSGFENLSNLVSNISEMNTDSLKHLFRQELDLLKQDFKKVITTNHIGTEPGHVAPEISFYWEGKAAAHTETPHTASAFLDKKIDVNTNVNSHSDKTLNEIVNQSTPDNVSKVHQLQNHISELGSCKLSQSQQSTTYMAGIRDTVAANGTLEIDMQQNVAVKPYAKVVTQPTRPHAKVVTQSTHPHAKVVTQSTCPHAAGAAEYSKNLRGRSVDAQVLHPSSFTFGESIVATGSYAEAISSQLKQMQSSRASSVCSIQRSDSSSSLKSINGGMVAKHDDPSAMVGTVQQEFIIENSEQFSVSNKPFLSPAMYSSGRPCRARVRINIVAGVFTVHIHVSKGIYDDSHKWPLQLSGFGYIWNAPSRRHTKLWQLHPVLCQKPPSKEKEFIFAADVCLKTLRGSYPKITYQQLAAKHYAENNRLTCIWDLQAVTD